MLTTTLNNFHAHPAQMRTTYDLDALASLTLQIYQRGLDNWQPVVAAPNGNGFNIISGHRRYMADLLAYLVRAWAADNEGIEVTIEIIRTLIAARVEALGSLDALLTDLLTSYGSEEIAFVPFKGSPKAEILALQAANFGSETPDALGIAHSFRQAVVAGASPEEIARNAGQHLNYVHNHLALTKIPPELAQRIASGQLPMSVATAVAALPKSKRTGLSIFILANDTNKLTAKAIKACASKLKAWSGLVQPLIVKHQSQRNIARVLVRLWTQAVEAYPDDAYAAATMLIYRNQHEEPWQNQDKLTLWFQVLGGDTYFANGRIQWTAVLQHLLPEVTCQACPIAQLPAQILHSDLSQGDSGALGMPCRSVETNPANGRCLHGLAPNDPFDVLVPWDWGDHLGILHETDYRAKSYDDLLQAWQAQAAKEQAEEEAASGKVEVASSEAKHAATASATSSTATPTATTTSQSANTSAPLPPNTSESSPIAIQRHQIATFIQTHEQFASSHPFATPCTHCRHKLDKSPTKDDTVPHCTWAGRPRRVAFQQLKSKEKQAPIIPVCRQFAPKDPWSERIPTHPSPCTVPRDWLQTNILNLVKQINRMGDRNAFEFLTGRPLRNSENYGNWFNEQFASQSGELSNEQLFTLFIWAHSEWQRLRRQPFLLPINDIQFATYSETTWKFPAQE